MAMSDADVIILMTDVADGITPTDAIAANRLRTTDKPVVLAVNKVDNDRREFNTPEFYQLGMGDPNPVSAYHNYGVHALMERVLSHLPTAEIADAALTDDDDEPDDETDLPALDEIDGVPPQAELNLAIVGRTNVGKSALLNAILGQERSIVSPVAGTTRDAIDTQFSYREREVVAVDTAGMRRRGQVERGIEKFSVIRAVGAVDRCDIAFIVVDASELATAQDTHIAGLAWEMGRGVIVVVNKWDLRTDQRFYAQMEADAVVRQRLHFMPYVPICFTSALNQDGLSELMDTALDLWNERRKIVTGRDLQFMLADAMADLMPPLVRRHRGMRARISRVRQVGINPPTFLFTVNNPQLVHFTYRRYLENKIRDSFGFDRTHLRLVFRRE
jgi:GTP-binding protein